MRRLGSIVRLACIATIVALGVGGSPPVVVGADHPVCPSSTDDAYALTVNALTGPAATDVMLRVVAAPGCADVTVVENVQVKTYDEEGKLVEVRNMKDVEANGHVAAMRIDRVPRGVRVEADTLVRTGTPPRTYVLRGSALSQLRPDLVVAAVHVPVQTLTTRPVDVAADITELNGDTGATATVALAGPIGPLAEPVDVTVPSGGRISVTFPGVALTTPATMELKVVVTDASPVETNADNNDRATTIDVSTNELARSRLLVQSLGGYGFQFNQHVYAPITSPPPETLPDLESKVKALEPQLVRIFYNENWDANADKKHPEWPENLDSFRRTVDLANDAGATIVIGYQVIGAAKTQPALWMAGFAGILQDLVQTRGDTNVRWVTIANEPNSISANVFSLAQYEALYRALDAELNARGLREHIGLIGGDLVQNTEATSGGHRAWFDYMVANMNDVIDAWSEHVYWRYDQSWRMEERLKDVAYLVHQELPEAARKPTLLMEYGVRGFDTCGAKPLLKFAYYPDADCTDLRRMPLAGFHKLWFSINAAQLGFDGASDWDLYWGVYDKSIPPNQSFWTIGPPQEGWALYPSYYALQLLLQTTARGWQVLGVDPWTADDHAARYDRITRDQLEQELTAFNGPDGQLTLVGLDTHGGFLTAPNGESSSYSIGGLPANTDFTLALWNASGDGKSAVAGTVTTSGAGVARFEVPMQAAFVLTTVPVE